MKACSQLHAMVPTSKGNSPDYTPNRRLGESKIDMDASRRQKFLPLPVAARIIVPIPDNSWKIAQLINQFTLKKPDF